MKRMMLTAVSALTLAGCASTMSMDGGKVDDHATITAKCGVGNYTFEHLKQPCREAANPTVSDYEYSDSDSIGTTASSEGDTDEYAANDFDLTQEVTFAKGSAQLSRADRETLNDVAWLIKSNDDRIMRVNIEGHTDASGTSDKNQSLSQARARTVRNFLVDRGVDPAKLTATGYGESMPKFNTSTSTAEELATNRRVDFAVETYDED